MSKEFNPTIANAICERLAAGDLLARIVEEPGMPTRSIVYRWCDENADFRLAYQRAREAGADALAEAAVHIGDDERDPQRARNRIDVRKWYASVTKPKVYGPKIDLNITEVIDPAALHAKGLQRARLMRDQAPVLVAQVIDGESVLVPEPTDAKSEHDDERTPSIFD